MYMFTFLELISRLIKSVKMLNFHIILKEYDFFRKRGVKIPGNLVNATISNKLSNEIIEAGN